MPCKEPFNWQQLLSVMWWKILILRITGGRPMIFVGVAFTDIVSGRPVNHYIDRFGREWLADSGNWSLFRVRRATDKVGE